MTKLLQPCSPYVRAFRGEPLLILTEPAERALCIMANGALVERSLRGFCAGPYAAAPLVITERQFQTLRTISRLRTEWLEWVATNDHF